MSKAKFEAVRRLIDEKDYSAARMLLRTIDETPDAAALAGKWLARLDAIAPDRPAVQRSFVWQAVATFVLYWFAVVPGLIANVLFLQDADRAEAAAGDRLPGVGALRFMWRLAWVIVVIALVGAVAGLVIVSRR